METTATRTGHFLWYELLASDKKAAIDFYTKVVGWNTQPFNFEGNEGPEYTMWLAGETAIGGVMEIDPKTMGEMPPMWTAYIHTADLDETIRRATELGGSVFVPTMEIPTVGRMAGLSDPQGATFWLLQPASSEPMPPPPELRSFSWNELATTDSQAASEFYGRLFGWKPLDESDMGGGWMYRMFGKGEKMLGGMFNKPADMPAPPHWLYYVKVDDLDAALERVKERGGQVLNGPMEVPGGDRVAQCLDPQGAAFALHEGKQ